MSRCPVCNQSPIERWKMAFVSPLSPFPCQHCGAVLKPSWLDYFFAVLPGSVIFMVAWFVGVDSSFEQYTGFAIGVFVMALCQVFFMPLASAAVVTTTSEPKKGEQ